jgi:two-component system phosphate regulon sensor histidine kinase PhoR
MFAIIAAIALVLLLAGGWFARRRIVALQQRLREGQRQRSQLDDRLNLLEHQRAVDLEMLNGLREGVLALNRDKRVALANRRFSELFSVADAIGKPLGEVVRVSTVFDALDRALAGEESVERFTIHSGVAESRIEMRALPLPSDEIAAVALFIDVTQLERLEQIRRNFISDFSHEVRTPLAGLRSAVESYVSGAGRLTAEDDAQLRKIMTRQLARLERLVNDLSELSRIESGDLTLDRSEVDLLALFQELAEDFADSAASRRSSIVVRGNGVTICVDRIRIQQAFSNLIDNAIKYGADGDTIDIEMLDDSDFATVRITDHGEGITAQERERIFRRFYRIDKSRSQDIVGSGLGLAITKHLVLLHKGTIDVASEPGHGSTFMVTLPKR